MESNEEYSRYLQECEYLCDVLYATSNDTPYLKNFNSMVRDRMIEKMKSIYKQEIHQYQCKLVDTGLVKPIVLNKLPTFMLVKLHRDVDSMFDRFVAKLLARETSHKVSVSFDKLKLSKKIKELLPKTPADKQAIYELCVKWILKVETTVDYIDRCKSYGLLRHDQLYETHKLRDNSEKQMPNSLVYKSTLNGFLNRAIEVSIQKICGMSVQGISKRVLEMLISFIVSVVFGSILAGIGGFALSFVDLSEMDFSFNIMEYALYPAIEYLKKKLRIGGSDICTMLLVESISQAEKVNHDMDVLLDKIVPLESSNYQLVALIEELNKTVSDLLSNKSKYVNEKIDDTLLKEKIVYEVDEDGWTIAKEFKECIKVEEDDDSEFAVVTTTLTNEEFNKTIADDICFVDDAVKADSDSNPVVIGREVENEDEDQDEHEDLFGNRQIRNQNERILASHYTANNTQQDLTPLPIPLNNDDSRHSDEESATRDTENKGKSEKVLDGTTEKQQQDVKPSNQATSSNSSRKNSLLTKNSDYLESKVIDSVTNTNFAKKTQGHKPLNRPSYQPSHPSDEDLDF